MMRERKITLLGETFHLREWGAEGLPKILMLHGFPEYGGAWGDLATHLSDRFHCIAPDQRGYGQSPAPAEVAAYRPKHLVADMAALIEAEGAPMIVLGHDWGSAVAYGLAILRPDLVSDLVVLNGVHPGPYQAALARGGAQTEAAQYIHTLRRDGSEDWLAKDDCARLMSLFGKAMDMSWMTPERARTYLDEWTRPGRLRGMVNWYRASPVQVPAPGETLDLPPAPPEAYRVRMRHLLIWGPGDTALVPEATEGLEAYCDDLTRAEVPGTDHWLAHQDPAAIARILSDWLDDGLKTGGPRD